MLDLTQQLSLLMQKWLKYWRGMNQKSHFNSSNHAILQSLPVSNMVTADVWHAVLKKIKRIRREINTGKQKCSRHNCVSVCAKALMCNHHYAELFVFVAVLMCRSCSPLNTPCSKHHVMTKHTV